jgi:hypothetical protein
MGRPTVDDFRHPIAKGMGFPMIESIDCMHWKYKRCHMDGEDSAQDRILDP